MIPITGKPGRKVLIALLLPLLCTANITNAGADDQHGMRDFTESINGWTDFDERRAHLEAQITASLENKQLTVEQADGFTSELSQMGKSAEQFRATGQTLTFTQSLGYTRDLNALSSRIQQIATHSKEELPNVINLRHELEDRLAKALAQGTISTADAEELAHDLKHVVDIEAMFVQAGHGKLTDRQSQILGADLEKARIKLDHQIRLSQLAVPELNKRKSDIERKIADAVASGHLPSNQASDLRGELRRITSLENAYLSAGAISGNSVSALAADLDKLSERLDLSSSTLGTTSVSAVSTGTVSTCELDATEMLLRSKIGRATAEHVLTADVTDDMERELGLIESLENAYKSSDTGITSDHVNRLISQLRSVIRRIDEVLNTGAKKLPTKAGAAPTASGSSNDYLIKKTDVETRTGLLRAKLQEAAKAGRLTPQELAAFNADIDKIDSPRASRSNRNTTELEGELHRLRMRVDQLLGTRKTIEVSLDNRRARLLKRINDALAADKLSKLEATLLNREYDRVTKLHMQLKASARGSLKPEQTSRLADELDQLENLVSEKFAEEERSNR